MLLNLRALQLHLLITFIKGQLRSLISNLLGMRVTTRMFLFTLVESWLMKRLPLLISR
ncbi:hypothetical protein NC651_030490 [Populus alba x Populus x berolinensis]|nr:hypothetical protein NC651_030490 [Populus alba x Populus x berolinensis]